MSPSPRLRRPPSRPGVTVDSSRPLCAIGSPLPSGTDAATNLMRIQSDAELLLASPGRFQSARGAAGIRATPGPVN
jgi:hypothetical protein